MTLRFSLRRLSIRLVVIVLGSFGGGEFVARFVFAPPQTVRVESKGPGHYHGSLHHAIDPGGSSLYVWLPQGKRLRPSAIAMVKNSNVSHQDIVVQTNQFGYRGPEVAPKRRDVRRLLFVGDSITLADYLSEEDTFVWQAEDRLRRRKHKVEAINAGVGATGLTEYIGIIAEALDRVEPDDVVLGLYLNDYQSSPALDLLRPPRMFEWSWLVQHLCYSLSLLKPPRRWFSVGPDVIERWRAEIDRTFEMREPRGEGDSFKALVLGSLEDWGGAWSEGAWVILAEGLRDVQTRLGSRGVRIWLVLFPVRAQVESSAIHDFPQRRLADVALRLGIDWSDPLPVLRSAWKRDREPLFYDQCHYTPEGNRLIAEIITELVTGSPRPGAGSS